MEHHFIGSFYTWHSFGFTEFFVEEEALITKQTSGFSGGCGVGGQTYSRTAEAPPRELSPPIVKAMGSALIEVKWAPPKKPNGIITNYFIHR